MMDYIQIILIFPSSRIKFTQTMAKSFNKNLNTNIRISQVSTGKLWRGIKSMIFTSTDGTSKFFGVKTINVLRNLFNSIDKNSIPVLGEEEVSKP